MKKDIILLSDYYLYFLIVCLKSSTATDDGWCSVHAMFENFINREFVVRDDRIFFTFEFGHSIDEMAQRLLKEDLDIIKTVYRFIWSISESSLMDLYCKHNMRKFWLDLSHKLGCPINIDEKFKIHF
jgi:hypothetical protein